jgi:hypothetical protein
VRNLFNLLDLIDFPIAANTNLRKLPQARVVAIGDNSLQLCCWYSQPHIIIIIIIIIIQREF